MIKDGARGKTPAAKILVVDDEECVRTLFAVALTNAGYEVNIAVDGRRAQGILKTDSHDLVITDLVMPDCEGIETIQAVRRDYPRTRIIAVSGAFGGSYLLPAARLGADVTLKKPVSPEQLLDVVQGILETRGPSAPW